MSPSRPIPSQRPHCELRAGAACGAGRGAKRGRYHRAPHVHAHGHLRHPVPILSPSPPCPARRGGAVPVGAAPALASRGQGACGRVPELCQGPSPVPADVRVACARVMPLGMPRALAASKAAGSSHVLPHEPRGRAHPARFGGRVVPPPLTPLMTPRQPPGVTPRRGRQPHVALPVSGLEPGRRQMPA